MINLGATFEPLFSDPEFFLRMGNTWFKRHQRTFLKWFEAFEIEYSPLENYNRTEETEYEKDNTEELTKHAEQVQNDKASSEFSNSGTVDTDVTGKENSLEIGKHNENENTKDLGHDSIKSGGYTEKGNSDINHMRKENLGSEHINTTNSVSGYNTNALVADNQSINTKQAVYNTYEDLPGNSGQHSDQYEKTIEYNAESEHTEGQTSIISGGDHNKEIESSSSEEIDTTTKANGESSSNLDRNITDDSKDDKIGNEKFKQKSHMYGNIGVTTSQQMLEAEIKVQRFDIYKAMANLFFDELCVRVF